MIKTFFFEGTNLLTAEGGVTRISESNKQSADFNSSFKVRLSESRGSLTSDRDSSHIRNSGNLSTRS